MLSIMHFSALVEFTQMAQLNSHTPSFLLRYCICVHTRMAGFISGFRSGRGGVGNAKYQTQSGVGGKYTIHVISNE